MQIRAGFDIAFQCPNEVAMVLMLTTPPTRDGDSVGEGASEFTPGVESRDFFDPFGNICKRLVAPAGLLQIRSEFVVNDPGLPDEGRPPARQWPVGDLPADV